MYELPREYNRRLEQLVREIEEYHTGSLWGFMRADPWTQRTLTTGLTPALEPMASNIFKNMQLNMGV